MLVWFVRLVLSVACWSIFFFKEKTAYEVRISDWSSDVCSSDLNRTGALTWLRMSKLPAQARKARHAAGVRWKCPPSWTLGSSGLATSSIEARTTNSRSRPSRLNASRRQSQTPFPNRSEARRGGKQCVSKATQLAVRATEKKKH